MVGTDCRCHAVCRPCCLSITLCPNRVSEHAIRHACALCQCFSDGLPDEGDVARGKDRLRLLPVTAPSAVYPVSTGSSVLAAADFCDPQPAGSVTVRATLPSMDTSARSRATCRFSVSVEPLTTDIRNLFARLRTGRTRYARKTVR